MGERFGWQFEKKGGGKVFRGVMTSHWGVKGMNEWAKTSQEERKGNFVVLLSPDHVRTPRYLIEKSKTWFTGQL